MVESKYAMRRIKRNSKKKVMRVSQIHLSGSFEDGAIRTTEFLGFPDPAGDHINCINDEIRGILKYKYVFDISLESTLVAVRTQASTEDEDLHSEGSQSGS